MRLQRQRAPSQALQRPPEASLAAWSLASGAERLLTVLQLLLAHLPPLQHQQQQWAPLLQQQRRPEWGRQAASHRLPAVQVVQQMASLPGMRCRVPVECNLCTCHMPIHHN